ncbi:hypothetical protein AURDEDRAFT_172524 [Auricularia subglabra TFB-10046 SS5]|nr:hypothetical protein AURDEDRAFT_172524 [Auricularia subglabra TFB-10046 SS5]
MTFPISLFRGAWSWWINFRSARGGLPTGWRVADERRDIFAEFAGNFLKEDLALWARIVLPASVAVADRLAYYGETWDFLCPVQRLEAQNLLKGVKVAYVTAMDGCALCA